MAIDVHLLAFPKLTTSSQQTMPAQTHRMQDQPGVSQTSCEQSAKAKASPSICPYYHIPGFVWIPQMQYKGYI